MGEKQIQFCTGGGCTAKLGPGALQRVLSRIPKPELKDGALLVGYDSSDDACVYQISDDLAIVQTLDFFPPMIEDPYLFGQVAAANALSDIYAMGGTVKTALNIVCFPESMDLDILGQILLGGNEKVLEAGGSLAGGHSIQDDGVKYGLSVMGFVDPREMWQNNTPEDGDSLLLTKPLGVGLICSAARAGDCDPVALEGAAASMTTLNRSASEVLKRYETHAVTDVTGFGLLGHLLEMVGEEHSAELDSLEIPRLPGALRYADEFYCTAAAQRNRTHAAGRVVFEHVPFAIEELLFDPQTSGGLLASLPGGDARAAREELRRMGLECGVIGTVRGRGDYSILVR